MKVIVNKAKQPTEYPCLMIGPEGEIVLFKEEQIGTNVSGKKYDLGHYSDAWIMSLFEPFYGSITLEND